MSTLPGRLFAFAAIGLTGLLGASPLSNQLRSLPVQEREDGATQSLPGFARQLAAARIPAGFVVRRSEIFATGRRTPRTAQGQTRSRTLGEVMTAFEERHPDYRGVEAHGGLLVGPRTNSPCMVALEQPVFGIRFKGPAYAAFFELARRIRTDLPDVPPGLVSGGGSGRGHEILKANIVLDISRASVGEVLFEIVRQAPGLVWAAVEESDKNRTGTRCMMLWYFDGGTAFTSYDIAASKSR